MQNYKNNRDCNIVSDANSLVSPSAERCIRFDDPALAIEFPIYVGELIFSDKDLNGMLFAEAEKFG